MASESGVHPTDAAVIACEVRKDMYAQLVAAAVKRICAAIDANPVVFEDDSKVKRWYMLAQIFLQGDRSALTGMRAIYAENFSLSSPIRRAIGRVMYAEMEIAGDESVVLESALWAMWHLGNAAERR